MGKPEGNSHLGIYVSPKEICIAQVKIGKDSKPVPEHLVKFPTGFPVKEGMLRPRSLNNEFFNEKAAWVAQFKQAVKRAYRRFYFRPRYIWKRVWAIDSWLEIRKYWTGVRTLLSI